MPDSSLCMAICKKYCIPSDIVVRYVEEFAPFKGKLRDDSPDTWMRVLEDCHR